MPKNKKITLAVTLVLVIAGLTLLGFSIFGDSSSQLARWYLPGGLFCVSLGNLINVYRLMKDKKAQNSERQTKQ